jgi:hypothetical protein
MCVCEQQKKIMKHRPTTGKGNVYIPAHYQGADMSFRLK